MMMIIIIIIIKLYTYTVKHNHVFFALLATSFGHYGYHQAYSVQELSKCYVTLTHY